MTDRHPESAEIAALDEDLLPEREAAGLRRHLAACAVCSHVQADLEELRRELAGLPVLDPSSGAEDVTDHVPERIPEDVAARIDAALAAETAAEQTAEQTPLPAASIEQPHSVSRETTSRSSAPEPSPAPSTRKGFSWPRLALAAVGATVAVGLGTALIQSLPLSADDADAGGPAAGIALDGETAHAGRDGSEGDPLAARVRALLAEAESSAPETWQHEESLSGAETAKPGEPRPTSALPACVAAAIGRGEPPLAAAADEYQGIESYVVVLPHAGDPGRVDAYVVDAACVGQESSEAGSQADEGQLLVHRSYPRE